MHLVAPAQSRWDQREGEVSDWRSVHSWSTLCLSDVSRVLLFDVVWTRVTCVFPFFPSASQRMRLMPLEESDSLREHRQIEKFSARCSWAKQWELYGTSGVKPGFRKSSIHDLSRLQSIGWSRVRLAHFGGPLKWSAFLGFWLKEVSVKPLDFTAILQDLWPLVMIARIPPASLSISVNV